ncbi:MAG: FIST N-terminal domain-containing protein [Pseudomonadota bacterium]
MSELNVARATTDELDVSRAVTALVETFPKNSTLVVCFVSPKYDLDALGPALTQAFPDAQVVGCTASGVIGEHGYQAEGMSAFALSGAVSGEALKIDVVNADDDSVAYAVRQIRERLCVMPSDERAFGLLLVDGMTTGVQEMISVFYDEVSALPIVGGSAGDDLSMERTYVLVDGEFRENAAALLLVQTPKPFQTFKLTHYEPTQTRLVVTEADPERWIVTEINGRPAAREYARVLGVDALTPELYSAHPVVLQVGRDHYVRAVVRLTEDDGLRFGCSVEKGSILRLAEPVDPMGKLASHFSQLPNTLGDVDLTLCFDCVFRRLEFEVNDRAEAVSEVLRDHGVVGFSTYGEQINGLHMNHTMTGVAIGAGR